MKLDPKWIRVLKFLRALGAPQPKIWSTAGGMAKFVDPNDENKWECLSIALATPSPGVAATDLFRCGLITLSEEAANFGGVPNLPIDELEKLLPKLIGPGE